MKQRHFTQAATNVEHDAEAEEVQEESDMEEHSSKSSHRESNADVDVESPSDESEDRGEVSMDIVEELQAVLERETRLLEENSSMVKRVQ